MPDMPGHSPAPHCQDSEPATGPLGRGIHHDWRFWVAVGLALGAMLAYVLSMDEALQPAETLQELAPATAADSSSS